MNILQVIMHTDQLYVFTENPSEDIQVFQDRYNADDELKIQLGCAKPELQDFVLLGQGHPCIWLWYDGEAMICEEAYDKFNKLIKR